MEPGQNTNGGMMGAGNPGFSGIAPRGGISSGSQTFPQSGEIVLASGPEKKGGAKKWIIIAFLVLFLAAAGVVIWMWATSRGGSSSGSDNGSVLDKYANYVINGDENNSNIGDEYVSNRSYYVAEQVYGASEEDFVLFYSNVIGMINSGMENYENSDIDDLLTEQKDLINMFYIYKKYESKIDLNNYFDDNRAAFQSELESVARPLVQSKNEYVAYYAKNILELASIIEGVVSVLYEAGCSGENVDELLSCDMSPEYRKVYVERNSGADKIYDDMRDMIDSAVPFYIRSIYEMLRYQLTVGEVAR